MSKYTIRAYRAEDDEQSKAQDEAGAEGGAPIRFTASTEGIKRDGMDLSLAQWDLSNFKRNPVFLWGHDYLGNRLPIGKVKIKPEAEEKRLVADVTFDQEDDFAKQVESKYRNGYLNAVSVGWNTILPDGKAMDQITKDDIRLDLLDLSGVPVPGDPDALMERFVRSLQEDGVRINTQHTRTVLPHRTDLAPLDESWDEAEERRTFTAVDFQESAAWVDDQIHPSSPSAYRFLHHNREGEAVWRAVSAAMVEFYLATAQVPDEDRKGVWQHLARHYQQFDKEPPEFIDREHASALTAEDIRGLFLEGEPDRFPEYFRKGAVLSKRNVNDLDQAISLLQGIKERSAKEETKDLDEEDETLRSIAALLGSTGD